MTDPKPHLSPLERAKAAYRPMRSLDELVGITERVKFDARDLERLNLTKED